MNNYAFEGEKARQAKICVELVDSKTNSEYYGSVREISGLLEDSFTDLITSDPAMRRAIRYATRNAMRNTLPDFVRYWLDGWPLTVAGAAALYGLVYVASVFAHWLGVV